MVGRERALAELEHFIAQCGGHRNAADNIGIAVSTLKRLKEQFWLVGEAALVPVPLALEPEEEIAGASATYVVEQRLGAGGMGVVYRVRRRSDGSHFAAKVLSSERFAISNVVRSRFLRECAIAVNFDSPRVVKSVECTRHRGTLVLVMELLNGANLHRSLQRPGSGLTPGQRIAWLDQICEGVAYLHARDVVHRDLSPRNCMFRADETIAVGDFGVARKTDDLTLTTDHERMGSLIYISPQQRENPHAASFTDDVFALGQIAYHLLSGRSPHGGFETLAELGYSAALDAWVRRLRNPRPNKRPTNGTECLSSLREILARKEETPMSIDDGLVQ